MILLWIYFANVSLQVFDHFYMTGWSDFLIRFQMTFYGPVQLKFALGVTLVHYWLSTQPFWTLTVLLGLRVTMAVVPRSLEWDERRVTAVCRGLILTSSFVGTAVRVKSARV